MEDNREIARRFAIEHGYADAEPLGVMDGFDCFEPVMGTEGSCCIGLPLMVMVSDGAARMSTYEEAMRSLLLLGDEEGGED